MTTLPEFQCSEECTPQEYAAFWGCDGAGDSAPNEPGDGAHFYNYNVIADWTTDQQREFYNKFIPAIERTILSVVGSPENFEDHDEDDLRLLLAWIEGELHDLH